MAQEQVEVGPPDLQPLLEALRALRDGDLSHRLSAGPTGVVGELAETFNSTQEQLARLTGELGRIHREIGTEGRFGCQAEVEGLTGEWQGLRDGANAMARSVTDQVRAISQGVEAVAQGDFRPRPMPAAQGETLALMTILSDHVKLLNRFAYEVTRLAREFGTEGRLGGQMEVAGAERAWQDLADNLNTMAVRLTHQLRDLGEVVQAMSEGDYSRRATCPAEGELLQVRNNLNAALDRLASE